MNPIQSVPICPHPTADDPIPAELGVTSEAGVSEAEGSGFAHWLQYCQEHNWDNVIQISCSKTL